MASGGFDAVLGNPPWERIKLQEQEYFCHPGHSYEAIVDRYPDRFSPELVKIAKQRLKRWESGS